MQAIPSWLRVTPASRDHGRHHMRHIKWLPLTAVLLGAGNIATAQQIGKYVPVHAGSDVDHALKEINAAADPAQKLTLIQKFADGIGKEGDNTILVDGLFWDICLSQKILRYVFD